MGGDEEAAGGHQEVAAGGAFWGQVDALLEAGGAAFEDVDFVSLHQELLDQYGEDMLLPGRIELCTADILRIKNLLKEKNVSKAWGWKDPRTLLFVDYYKNLLDNPRFI